MAMHLIRDLDQLKKDLLSMGALVEESLSKAVTALVDRRDDLVQEVIDSDNEIDEREVGVEEECLKMLALHQPVASDLRFIVTVMKVNSDLERMGDHAVNMAERARFLNRQPQLALNINFGALARYVQLMVRESLDSLVNRDSKLAHRVCRDDGHVDEENRKLYHWLVDQMAADPSLVPAGVEVLSASKQLERIADLATNIAEDVVFLIDGDVIRHRMTSSPVSDEEAKA
jgi:phosphate transport system protein